MRPRLIARPGAPDEEIFELRAGSHTVGRTSDNDVCLSDRSLSRVHARIDVGPLEVVLFDLDSKNGTFVDGTRVVGRCVLGEANTIRFGEVELRYVARRAAPARAVPPAPARTVPRAPALTRDIATDIIRVPIRDIVGETGWLRGPSQRPSKDASLDRDRSKLRILLKVSQLLSSPSSLDAVLGSVLDLAFEILDIDRGAILMVSPETGALEPRVTRAHKGAASFSTSIARYVIDANVAALFSDASIDERLADAGSVMMQSIRTSMCAPLKPGDTMLGVLYVDNVTSPNRFDSDDLELLSAFANQSAIAIQNAILGERLAREAVMRNNLLRFFPPTAIPALDDGANGFRTIETEATVLFSDISGYTELSSGMKPTEIIELLNAYFPLVAEIVFRHEGALEKYIGDALLAVWGVPVKHDNDAERAVRAAIEMQRVVHDLNDRRKGAPPIRIHIGVNSGMVAAGNIGSKDYIQFATIGDTTNVASRICTVAQPGEIVIDEGTATRLPSSMLLEPLGPTLLRGKAEPVNLFRVRG